MQSFFKRSYLNLGDATLNQPINQWIRNRLLDQKIHWKAVAAIKSLIDEYGATAPHLLLPRMQEVDSHYFPG